ncbi:MAG: hypothetical protein JKY12_05040 [Sneathiella sp.]|nr:hypothetical protein [Sneathiella sp.]
MQKFLFIVCFVGSLGLFGWTLNDYATSGGQLFTAPLSHKYGSLPPVYLDPSMSPMRLLLKVRYEVDLRDLTNQTYVFDVVVKDPAGDIVLSARGAPSEKKSDKGEVTQRNTQNHVLGSFDVLEDGAFLIDWKVEARRAKIKQMTIELRRNVSDLNILNLVIAGALFSFGVILIFLRRFRQAE